MQQRLQSDTFAPFVYNCHPLQFILILSKVNILLLISVAFELIVISSSMNSLPLLVVFRQQSNLVVRQCSSRQTDRFKLLNYTTKALYGPVIKRKTLKSESTKLKVEETPTKLKKSETAYSSEMFWLLGKRSSEPKISGDSKAKKASKVPSNKPSKEVRPGGKEKIVRSEILKSDETKTIEPYVNTVVESPILLSNEQLNNILDHPLQSEIVTTSISDIRGPKFRNVPSVGRVLQYTMSESARAALLNWKLSKIRELGEQGFADLQKGKITNIG